MDELQLRWLEYNRRDSGEDEKAPERQELAERHRRRRRYRDATRVGDLARGVLAGRQQGSALLRRIWLVLEEHCGNELLEEVSIRGVSRGILTLQASEPAVMCHLRMQWEQPVLALMQTHLPDAGINSIRFTVVGLR